MSYFDDASLVMIPSGYKTSKVYSVKPTNGTGDLAFTRSNDTATRVGPDGLIQKVRTNLILQSNTFSTTWLNSNSTETGGQAGYDGTNNAWKLTASSAGGHIYQDITIAGLVTFSIYAKAGSEIGITLYSGHASQGRYFNLSTGALGGAFANVPLDSKIESIGSGWYRCSITVSATNTNNFRAYVSNGTANVVGDILIQAAQVETGDIATDYIATTTAAVSVGPVANVPRLDYLGSSCPRLLLEPQRTNLMLWSEQMDNAGWAKSGASVTANAVLGPDGYTSADKLVEDTSTGVHIATQSNLFTATGAWHTASIFVKAAERTYAAFSTRGNFTSNENTLIFNLTTGEWELDDSSQNYALNAEAFPNGWYRISLNTNTTSAAYDGFGIGIATGSTSWGDAVYTGDGTSGIYIWGAQIEAGAYATSYIPTLGASVTRGADACVKTGISSLIGQTEGTLFVEFNLLNINPAQVSRIILSDGTTDNYIFLGINESGSGNLSRLFINNTAASLSLSLFSSTAITVGRHKLALAYKSGSFALYLDGNSVATSATTGTIPPTSQLVIGGTSPTAVSNLETLTLLQSLLFPTRLTNAQLAELTTI